MDKIKIAQIGVCHEHAAAKFETLRKLNDVFEIVGVVDDRDSVAARRGDIDMVAYQGFRQLSEEELFSLPDLQAVLVETANDDLVATALRCAEQNLAIHMDKPGAYDLSLFEKLLLSCVENKLPFQMGYMFRHNQAMQWCIQACRKGLLGEIVEIQGDMHHDYGGEDYQRYMSEIKGGTMFNLGCHLIDFIVEILGAPDAVIPSLRSAPGYGDEIKNNCLCVLEYPHASAVVRVCSKVNDGLKRRSLRVCGAKGVFELSPHERFDGKPAEMHVTFYEGNEQYQVGDHCIAMDIKDDRYSDQLLELARIIRGEVSNPFNYEHEFLVQQTLLAASDCSAVLEQI